MAKNSIRDYDNTSGNNTDIQSVDISEGCSPAGINNAIREVMADLADVNDGTVALTSPSADSMTVTGDLTVDTNTLHVDSANNRVGIGTTSPTDSQLDVRGTAGVKIGDGTCTLELLGRSDLGYAIIGTDTNHPIAMRTNNTERMRIDSAGQVGIGTSSPEYVLDVDDASGNAYIAINRATQSQGEVGFKLGGGTSGDDWYIYQPTSTNNLSFYKGDDKVTIDSSGNVGIGTSSPLGKLEVKGAGFVASHISSDSTSETQLRFNTNTAARISNQANTALIFDTNATERMRIDSSGHVGIGVTSPIYVVDAKSTTNGDIIFRAQHQGSGSVAFHASYGSSSGTAYFGWWKYNNAVVGSITSTGSSTSYNTSSDYRLKENVVDLTGAIARVKSLQPKRFNFIADADTTVDGFLAHEAQTVVPEAVTGTHNETETIGDITDADSNIVETDVVEPDTLEDGHTWTGTGTQPVYQGIDQAKLVPLLTAALQEAIAKIEALEAQNADFETRLTALEAE